MTKTQAINLLKMDSTNQWYMIQIQGEIYAVGHKFAGTYQNYDKAKKEILGY